jgi:hypothetical protein
MKKSILSFILILFCAGISLAYTDGGLTTVTGYDGYKGLKGFLELGGDSGFYVRPSMSSYDTDSLNDPINTYAIRGGLDKMFLSLGAEAGVTPRANGYKNHYFTGDVTISFSPLSGNKYMLAGPRSATETKGKGMLRADVGSSITYIKHDVSGFGVGETDMSVYAGLLFLGTQVSGQYIKNLDYSRTLNTGNSDPLKIDLPGMIISAVGYVSQVWNGKVSFTMIPFVSPYFSYTSTQYKINRPRSDSYVVGATLQVAMVFVNASYQIFDPGPGLAKKDYFGLSGGLKF